MDAALLASFDERQSFHVTLCDGVKKREEIVVTTLEDVMKRGERFVAAVLEREYIRRKQDWSRRHPEATSQEYEQACRAIAKELGI